MIIVMAIFMLPLLAGIIGLILPAFGYFPPLGFHAVSLSGLGDWLATPGLWPATWRSFLLGMLAAALSLMACFTLLVAALSSGRLHNTKWVRALARLLGPLISHRRGLVIFTQPLWLADPSYLALFHRMAETTC